MKISLVQIIDQRRARCWEGGKANINEIYFVVLEDRWDHFWRCEIFMYLVYLCFSLEIKKKKQFRILLDLHIRFIHVQEILLIRSKNFIFRLVRDAMKLKTGNPQQAHLGILLKLHTKILLLSSIWRGIMRETNRNIRKPNQKKGL